MYAHFACHIILHLIMSLSNSSIGKAHVPDQILLKQLMPRVSETVIEVNIMACSVVSTLSNGIEVCRYI